MSIVIYSSKNCPFCELEKKILDSKNLSYKVIDVGSDIQKRKELILKSNGRRTVPQIFINDKHIGGYDELSLLNSKGKLI